MNLRNASRLLLLIMCLSPAPMTVVAATGDNAMPAELVDFFGGVRSIRGEFRQILFDPAGNVVETSEGDLAISKPGRFRWRYRDPYEQLIVADGEKLWLYDVDLEQVTVREQTETIRSSPAMLLGGEATALDEFHYVGTYSAEGYDWLRLEPVQPESDFRSVSLAFSEGELLMMELSDALNQTTRIEFSGLELNEDLDDSLFTFDLPPDVDVVGGEILSRVQPTAPSD